MKIDLIKKIIKSETSNSNNKWVQLDKIILICRSDYNITVSYQNFKNHPSFRIYRTASSIYIALAEDFNIARSILDNNRIKPPQKQPTKIYSSNNNESQLKSRLSKINTPEDLSTALVGILTDLTAISPEKSIDIATLSKHFYSVYRQPIKPLLNTLVPGMKLIEYLQCYDSFIMNKVDEKWKVFLNNFQEKHLT
jgi:hypothetical protein